jgi:hypothetical protein
VATDYKRKTEYALQDIVFNIWFYVAVIMKTQINFICYFDLSLENGML